MSEDKMNVQAPVGAEEEKVPEVEEYSGNDDLAMVVEELKDLVAEIVDVVDKLAESINSVKGAKEEIAEAMKELKKEFEIMKAEIKVGEADKEEEQKRKENYPDGKEPEAVGEEVKVPVEELAPKPDVVETERPVTVEKGVVDDDVISKILYGDVGVNELARIEKSFVMKR